MLIELTAYIEDCTISGSFELEGERLSDALNRDATLRLERATVVSLDGMSQLCVRTMELDRGEVCAVEAHDRGGATGRSIHTVRHRLKVHVGPYTILGQLHEKPGVAPLSSLRISQPMVPVTDATLAFVRGDAPRVVDVDTLLVNGARVSWISSPLAEEARPFGRTVPATVEAG